MIDWAISQLPGTHLDHAEVATWLMFVMAAGVGLLIGVVCFHTHWVTRTRVTHPSVAQLLGRPDTSIPGTQINSQLTGIVCDIYQSKHIIYCH